MLIRYIFNSKVQSSFAFVPSGNEFEIQDGFDLDAINLYVCFHFLFGFVHSVFVVAAVEMIIINST